jgi:hypothetical protein
VKNTEKINIHLQEKVREKSTKLSAADLERKIFER